MSIRLVVGVAMLASIVIPRDSVAAPPVCTGLAAAVTAEIDAQPPARGSDAVFIRSYEPAADETRLPAGLASTAFVYDNALAVIALTACGETQLASTIGRALRIAAQEDRTFHDGRIRNAYRAGPVGEGPPALPGWWDARARIWAEDAAQDGTSTGNVAWAALALLTLHQTSGDAADLAAARRLIDWIITHTPCDGGFCGGFHGYDPQQVRLTWMSTEHNVDVAAAASWLARLTGEPTYRAAAARARQLLDRAFQGDHFLLGTRPDGSLADPAMLALDVQLWPWMALPDAPPAWRAALGFAEQHLAVDGSFDFNGDRDGVWVEGTAQAALAYRIAGHPARAEQLLAGLATDRTASGLLNATRIAQITTGLSIDPTSTVPDFFYLRRPHLGATAWAVLAATGWNPFTGARVP